MSDSKSTPEGDEVNEGPTPIGSVVPDAPDGETLPVDSRDWVHRLAGLFIVFDGPDGSGKSTQHRRFISHCRAQGVDVLEVREPGGTSIGEQIRTLLLDNANHDMSIRCEMMLYMASRAQLMEEKIRPAQRAGRLVVADRFISSTLAYQGTAGGLPEAEIIDVGRVVLGGVWPDLTIIFDVDEHTAAGRLNPLLDRMESKGAEFHRRVREGFLDQARAHPDRYLVVDADGDEDEVWARLTSALEQWRTTA